MNLLDQQLLRLVDRLLADRGVLKIIKNQNESIEIKDHLEPKIRDQPWGAG